MLQSALSDVLSCSHGLKMLASVDKKIENFDSEGKRRKKRMHRAYSLAAKLNALVQTED